MHNNLARIREEFKVLVRSVFAILKMYYEPVQVLDIDLGSREAKKAVECLIQKKERM